MPPLLKYLVFCLVPLSLVGCSVLDKLGPLSPKNIKEFVLPSGSKLPWSGVVISASADANLNSPVAMDIVLLNDEASVAMVSALPASKWFATRADLQKTFPQGVKYRSFEVVPGQSIRLPEADFASTRVAAAFVFADYLSPGEHRIRVDQLQGELLIQLGPRAFTVTSQPR